MSIQSTSKNNINFCSKYFYNRRKYESKFFSIIPEYKNNYHYVTHLPNRTLAESYLQQKLINQDDQKNSYFIN